MKTACLFLLLLAGISPSVSAQHDLNGYWEDQNGNHFYIRHLDNNIYWFAEGKTGGWANAFKGTIANNTRAALLGGRPITIQGQFYDLPKGQAQGSGPLVWTVESSTRIIKNSGAFGSTPLVKKTKPRNLPGNRSAGFSGTGITGVWNCNDRGNYYMRETGGAVVWYGEYTVGSSTTFSNVAFGTRSGNTINLEWVDIPKGNSTGHGSLRLQVNGNQITRTSGSGFGGSLWTKTQKSEVKVALFDFLLAGYAMAIGVNLNNYAETGGSPRWYKADDAYVNLPRSWGRRFNLSLPEISQENKFRTYHYYVNDVKSVSRGVTAKLVAKREIGSFLKSSTATQKQPVIKMEIPLETDGTEIIGRCTSCPSSDKGAPDIQINPKNYKFPTVFLSIPLTVRDGRLTYESINTHFDANIDAGGICSITRNLCDRITGYKDRIPQEIDKGFKDSFNNPAIKEDFETSLNNAIPEAIRGKITKLYIEGTMVVLEYE